MCTRRYNHKATWYCSTDSQNSHESHQFKRKITVLLLFRTSRWWQCRCASSPQISLIYWVDTALPYFLLLIPLANVLSTILKSTVKSKINNNKHEKNMEETLISDSKFNIQVKQLTIWWVSRGASSLPNKLSMLSIYSVAISFLLIPKE